MKTTSHLRSPTNPCLKGSIKRLPLRRVFLFGLIAMIYVVLRPIAYPAIIICDTYPTATATTTNVTVAGGTLYSFTVTYESCTDVSTLDNQDVRIRGPGGFNSATRLVSFSPITNGIRATYSFVPPGGSWDSGDNGIYYVEMQVNQVFCGSCPVQPFASPFNVAIPAPSGPIAEPATYVASYSFTANWSRVSVATGYRLDVSTNSSFSTYVTGYENLNLGNATSRSVTGLNPSTTYHYRVRAYNGHGTSGNSNIVNVTTLSPTGRPVAITNPASYIASYSARLNGSVDPHGLTTTVYFQYGTTISYGLTTAIQSKTGNTYQSVVATIGDLTASTTYHFRIVATNSAGTVYGSDTTFTTLSATGLPVVITNPATNVTSSSVTLNGSVDPHGLTTNVHFQYGTTNSYGHHTANQSKTGNAYQNVAANISGLSASTTYHFRIVATNSAGTRYGGDRTFTTP